MLFSFAVYIGSDDVNRCYIELFGLFVCRKLIWKTDTLPMRDLMSIYSIWFGSARLGMDWRAIAWICFVSSIPAHYNGNLTRQYAKWNHSAQFNGVNAFPISRHSYQLIPAVDEKRENNIIFPLELKCSRFTNYHQNK